MGRFGLPIKETTMPRAANGGLSVERLRELARAGAEVTLISGIGQFRAAFGLLVALCAAGLVNEIL